MRGGRQFSVFSLQGTTNHTDYTNSCGPFPQATRRLAVSAVSARPQFPRKKPLGVGIVTSDGPIGGSRRKHDGRREAADFIRVYSIPEKRCVCKRNAVHLGRKPSGDKGIDQKQNGPPLIQPMSAEKLVTHLLAAGHSQASVNDPRGADFLTVPGKLAGVSG